MPILKTILMIGITAVAGALPVNAAASWTLFGLEGESVNTILPLSPGNGDDAIMVGTSKGIWNHEYGHWVSVWQGLPVYDMQLIAYDRILAAAGNGSDSDGIYLGKVIAIGEPGNLWKFTLLVKYPRPTAVGYRSAGLSGSRCDGTVYVGNASRVSSGAHCGDSVEALTALEIPENSWSKCTALRYSPIDHALWAGGTFGNRMAAGPMNDTATLLRGTSSLDAFRKMDVLSINDFVPSDDSLFSIATYYSGVQIFKGDTLLRSIPSPKNNYPVLAAIHFTKLSSGETLLAAATPSGVYRECPPNADCIWTDLDANISAVYTCLAQQKGTVLWLGTTIGVYRYESVPTARRVAGVGRHAAESSVRFTLHGGVLYAGTDKAGSTLQLFDTRGRSLKTTTSPNGEVRINGSGRGCYIYRLTCNNKCISSGSVIISQ